MTQAKEEELNRKIEQFKSSKTEKASKIEGGSAAFNIAVELLASMITGVIIGLGLDNLFASKPTFLIICLLISAVAAFRLIFQRYISNK